MSVSILNPPRSLNGRFTGTLTDKPYGTKVGFGANSTHSGRRGPMAQPRR